MSHTSYMQLRDSEVIQKLIDVIGNSCECFNSLDDIVSLFKSAYPKKNVIHYGISQATDTDVSKIITPFGYIFVQHRELIQPTTSTGLIRELIKSNSYNGLITSSNSIDIITHSKPIKLVETEHIGFKLDCENIYRLGAPYQEKNVRIDLEFGTVPGYKLYESQEKKYLIMTHTRFD